MAGFGRGWGQRERERERHKRLRHHRRLAALKYARNWTRGEPTVLP